MNARNLCAGGRVLLALSVWAVCRPAGAQQPAQLSPEEAAQVVLDGARRAYGEGKFDVAAERFREFLKSYGGHAEATSAQYGLARALLAGPVAGRDYAAAIAALQQAAGRPGFANAPHAAYLIGDCQRALGERSVAEAEARPDQAAQHRGVAAQRFAEAAASFAAAAQAFAAAAPKSDPPPARLPDELEWAARARCDQCEMMLRLERFKEAAQLAEGLLADKAFAGSRSVTLATYQLGFARFALTEYVPAGRALGELAPFDQAGFGPHARFMLGRIHHIAGEGPEAERHYKALTGQYERDKKAAAEALKNPAALAPARKAELEAIVAAPPDYAVRASFYAALIQAETGRLAEAEQAFAAFGGAHPKHPLAPEAQLRQGYCLLEMKKLPEASKALQPLTEHAALGDRACWWVARAQVAGADPANIPLYVQTLGQAIGLLRRAADKAGQLAKTDPEAKLRRGDILIELGDTQQLARQYREAAATYLQARNENNNPDRADEGLQRQIVALHLAGAHAESDALCVQFEKTYPKSMLTASVLFRSAENAYMSAVAAAANPNLPNRQQELSRRFALAIARYRRVVEEYPEFAYAHLARYGMASAYHRLGRYQDAIDVLGGIPDSDRGGELAGVRYLLADCLIRTLPERADDAVQAASVMERAEQAAELLAAFVGADPKSPQAAEALLKLGHCRRRIAAVLARDAERAKALETARGVYERLIREYPQSPVVPLAVFERANCLAAQGQAPAAVNELNRFQQDPYRATPAGGLALIRLSELMRSQNRAAQAVGVMANARAALEAKLLNDPERKAWVPAMQYEHAVALQQADKLAEAQAILDAIVKQFADAPEAADALWRSAQCRRIELARRIDAARAAQAKAGANAQQIAAAAAATDEAVKALAATVETLVAAAGELGRRDPGGEGHVRTLYEAAWCYRTIADAEIEAARQRLRTEAAQRLRQRREKRAPPAPPATEAPAPDVPVADVAIQLSESAAQRQYARLIDAAPEDPLAVQARLELAEMHDHRGSHAAAVELLTDALAQGPPAELANRIRLRLASACLGAGDVKGALIHAGAVTGNVNSPLVGQARYLIGEAHARSGDPAKAAEALLALRDHGPFQNLPGVSDRALLRLGEVYAAVGQWDASRQTLSILVQRFPNSQWASRAFYGIGLAWQSQNNFDQAANAYAEVTRRFADELAAEAQLGIGLCRLAQKKHAEAAAALMTVPATYDFPDTSARALVSAGEAYVELKQLDEAEKCWQEALRECPAGKAADAARRHLDAIGRPVAAGGGGSS